MQLRISRIMLLSLHLPLSFGGQTDYKPNVMLKGFAFVGPIESSCVFKPLTVVEDPVPIEAQTGFHGEQAKTDLYTHLRSRPPQHHKKILEATVVEQQRGW